jgi:hypothetical protein
MKGSDFDEIAFFDALARSDVRALLIGRRALVVLGDIRLLELVGPEGEP